MRIEQSRPSGRINRRQLLGTLSRGIVVAGPSIILPGRAAYAQQVQHRRFVLMKTVFACLLLILLLSLTPEDRQATAAMFGPKGCYDPADYGAIPNDDVSDRVPAQQALDAASAAGGRVCFGAGVWTLTRAPVGSYNRFAALSTHGQHVEISGEGPSTVLSIEGD